MVYRLTKPNLFYLVIKLYYKFRIKIDNNNCIFIENNIKIIFFLKSIKKLKNLIPSFKTKNLWKTINNNIFKDKKKKNSNKI